jgi:hypothetical protein
MGQEKRGIVYIADWPGRKTYATWIMLWTGTGRLVTLTSGTLAQTSVAASEDIPSRTVMPATWR